MPMYSVWYRENEEPFAFVATTRCSEVEIVRRVLTHANIAAPVQAGDTAHALIAGNELAPVRYTEDESEMNVIS